MKIWKVTLLCNLFDFDNYRTLLEVSLWLMYMYVTICVFLQDSTQLGDNAFTLFYGKFRANAPRVKALMEQLEIRLDKSPE